MYFRKRSEGMFLYEHILRKEGDETYFGDNVIGKEILAIMWKGK